MSAIRHNGRMHTLPDDPELLHDEEDLGVLGNQTPPVLPVKLHLVRVDLGRLKTVVRAESDAYT
jgi:hypothetical protein